MRYLKNILKVIVFFSGLMIILYFLSFVFVPKNNLEVLGMTQVKANGILGEKENTVDLLVLGDSESFTSIFPMQLWDDYGFTTYICGTSSQYLYDTYLFLKKALKNQNPKIVILGTNAVYRKIPAGNVIGSIGKQMLPIFRYHNRWKKLTLSDFGGKVKYTWTDDWKGFNYSTDVRKPISNEYMVYTEDLESIPLLNQYYLEKIKEICEDNDIKLILVSTPSFINWNYKKHNGMLKYATDNKLEYLDFNTMNDILGIDWNLDTRDRGDHLNFNGARKVTTYMGNYLYSLGILENHKGDDKYKSWSDAFKKYQNNELKQ